jgi:glycosyltransferase involved in cell wall biosynthesis
VRDVAIAVPGDLSSPTGGYEYDRQLIALLPSHGLRVRHLALPAGFPHPSSEDLHETWRALARIAPDSVLLIDGLAYGAFTPEVTAGIRSPIVALVHHPLAYETGLCAARRSALRDSERAALARADIVVATSPSTRAILGREYGVSSSRLFVAEPGAQRVTRARGPQGPDVRGAPTILAVGAVSPRKGYDLLVEALRPLAGRQWRAVIAGSLTHDPATAAALRRQIGSSGLAQRITLPGAVSDEALAALYAGADLFVLSSLYEGYGMALANAMAHGLAIVSTTGGAAAETVPDGAALKVAPGDASALTDAIARLLDDIDLRRALADASWRAGQKLPRWEDTASVVATAIRSVA